MAFEFDVREIPLAVPIGVLIDAGVNLGQFAREALPHFKPALYHGFEILPDLVDGLRRDALFHDGKTRIIWHLGLGEVSGTARVRRVDWHPSSSLLRINPEAGAWYGYNMTQHESVEVPMTTLDEFCRDIPKIDLIKIDVQGYEGRVLRGGKETLRKTSCVVVEVLACQHYFEQSTPGEIDGLLEQGGFKFVKWLRQHPTSGEMLEGDALYAK